MNEVETEAIDSKLESILERQKLATKLSNVFLFIAAISLVPYAFGPLVLEKISHHLMDLRYFSVLPLISVALAFIAREYKHSFENEVFMLEDLKYTRSSR